MVGLCDDNGHILLGQGMGRGCGLVSRVQLLPLLFRSTWRKTSGPTPSASPSLRPLWFTETQAQSSRLLIILPPCPAPRAPGPQQSLANAENAGRHISLQDRSPPAIKSSVHHGPVRRHDIQATDEPIVPAHIPLTQEAVKRRCRSSDAGMVCAIHGGIHPRVRPCPVEQQAISLAREPKGDAHEFVRTDSRPVLDTYAVHVRAG